MSRCTGTESELKRKVWEASKGVGKSVDEGLAGVVPVGHRSGLYPAQVGEAHIDLRGQPPERQSLGPPQFSNSFTECHRKPK